MSEPFYKNSDVFENHIDSLKARGEFTEVEYNPETFTSFSQGSITY
jgi:hypothetical protein